MGGTLCPTKKVKQPAQWMGEESNLIADEDL